MDSKYDTLHWNRFWMLRMGTLEDYTGGEQQKIAPRRAPERAGLSAGLRGTLYRQVFVKIMNRPHHSP